MAYDDKFDFSDFMVNSIQLIYGCENCQTKDCENCSGGSAIAAITRKENAKACDDKSDFMANSIQQRYGCENCKTKDCENCSGGFAIAAITAMRKTGADLQGNIGCPYVNKLVSDSKCEGCDQCKGSECWVDFYMQKGFEQLKAEDCAERGYKNVDN